MHFHIELAALSKHPLIQKGWDTKISDTVLKGYKRVNTIEYSQLMAKYNIPFDTIVADCEGAFYYILRDFPEILNNIRLIVMENDYHEIEHKHFVDFILEQNGFRLFYNQEGGWGPCKPCFFQAWRKIESTS